MVEISSKEKSYSPRSIDDEEVIEFPGGVEEV
jgi:hypothetical protein